MRRGGHAAPALRPRRRLPRVQRGAQGHEWPVRATGDRRHLRGGGAGGHPRGRRLLLQGVHGSPAGRRPHLHLHCLAWARALRAIGAAGPALAQSRRRRRVPQGKPGAAVRRRGMPLGAPGAAGHREAVHRRVAFGIPQHQVPPAHRFHLAVLGRRGGLQLAALRVAADALLHPPTPPLGDGHLGRRLPVTVVRLQEGHASQTPSCSSGPCQSCALDPAVPAASCAENMLQLWRGGALALARSSARVFAG
mmetsp:Transcript_52441/g.162814  ORF Transcript_52441/g.162814 Transcript_52441/m.162814 type:complete len:250 (+) Transcript_52441:262-1011(+)